MVGLLRSFFDVKQLLLRSVLDVLLAGVSGLVAGWLVASMSWQLLSAGRLPDGWLT